MPANSARHHSHTILHLVIIVLIFIALFAFAKHFIRQAKWSSYVVEQQQDVAEIKNADSAKDAEVIGMTIVSLPTTSPLISQPKPLQSYIESVAEKMGRVISILGTDRKVIASSQDLNVGTSYAGDKNGEVAKTIGDGIARSFTEESVDYPNGLSNTVIALKNGNGATIGAIVISSSPIFETK